jgi:hypothetical protein
MLVSFILGLEPALDLASIVLRRFRRPAYSSHLAPLSFILYPYRIVVLIVVLDRNPLQIDPADIRNIRVLATVLGGRVTYSDLPEYDRVRPL